MNLLLIRLTVEKILYFVAQNILLAGDLTEKSSGYEKFESEKQLKFRPVFSRGNLHVRCQESVSFYGYGAKSQQ